MKVLSLDLDRAGKIQDGDLETDRKVLSSWNFSKRIQRWAIARLSNASNSPRRARQLMPSPLGHPISVCR